MSTQVKTAVVDSDAHVLETERTWEYMTQEEQAHRPVIPRAPRPGKRRRVLARRGPGVPQEYEPVRAVSPRRAARRRTFPCGWRTWTRWALTSTCSIRRSSCALLPSTPRSTSRSHAATNRWLADISRQGGGRLRWALVPPLMDPRRRHRRAAFRQGERRVRRLRPAGSRATDGSPIPICSRSTRRRSASTCRSASTPASESSTTSTCSAATWVSARSNCRCWGRSTTS